MFFLIRPAPPPFASGLLPLQQSKASCALRVVRSGCLTLALLGAAFSSFAAPAHATSASSIQKQDGVGAFLDRVVASGVSLFSPSSASAHAQHSKHTIHRARRKTVPRHTTPQAPGWGVPQGVIASSGIVTPDGTTHLVEWDGKIATLQTGATSHPPAWAAVLVDGTQLAKACSAGWVRPLEAATNCGLPGGHEDVALAWDRSRLPGQPGWAAFWSVARHPGRRGLHFGARGTLEIALLADGVGPDDVYNQLSTPAGVDRAFRKLDVLRPYIVWWRTPDDAARIMQQSGALMTSAPVSEITSISAHVKAGAATSIFVAETDQMIRTPLFWAVPSTVSDNDARQTLERLHIQSPHLEDVPDSLNDTHTHALTISDTFWLANGDALEQRFRTWFGSDTP